MIANLETFLTEIRTMPGFVAAVAKDPGRIREIDGIERALLAVDRLANDEPAVIDISDEIQATIGRADLSMKAKLLEVGRLLGQARDHIKFVH
jgi:hypothetical protein